MPTTTYASLKYDPTTGRLQGVLTGDGSVIPNDDSNLDWQAFLTWNSTQPVPWDLSNKPPVVIRVPRPLLNIYTDISALTAAQKTSINNNLFTGTPPKFAGDVGPNAASLLVLWMLQQVGNLSAADKNLVKQCAASIYVLDNPRYLVNPAFDATINVPGDQPIT